MYLTVHKKKYMNNNNIIFLCSILKAYNREKSIETDKKSDKMLEIGDKDIKITHFGSFSKDLFY
jgi:hypothetical protein